MFTSAWLSALNPKRFPSETVLLIEARWKVVVPSTITPPAAHLENTRVRDEEEANVRGLEVDAEARHAIDADITKVQRQAGEEADTIQTAADAIDGEILQHDLRGRRRVDDDAVDQSREDAAAAGRAAVDGDGLGDRDCAEAAGIECIDLAAGCGLADRARERLARGRAAAGIGVVTHARHPGARRLRLRHGGGCQEHRSNSNRCQERRFLQKCHISLLTNGFWPSCRALGGQ